MSNTPHHALEREAHMAAFATRGSQSQGRAIKERDCPMRSPFQRDRDRIVHATAFRRLTYKTQVFLYHEGDHYRTRLTHTLEVAQIARALARMLRLDEDLAEALALAHDLGHPPFGHTGERALDTAMAPYGGFDHNAQSLKVVTDLERKYAAFDGLNLTWETLEGLVKHNGPLTGPHATRAHAGGSDTAKLVAIPASITRFNARYDLKLSQFASVEAQVAAIADDIAYNNHDIDDGLRAGLISLDELRHVPLAGRFVVQVLTSYPDLDDQRVIYEVNRRLITAMVEDAAQEAQRRLGELRPQSVQDIYHAAQPVVAFSDELAGDLQQLRAFLFSHVYRHPKVMTVMNAAGDIVSDLFARLLEQPLELPAGWRRDLVLAGDKAVQAGHIGDFVAGMTDRFAIGEHRRLFDDTPKLR